LDEHVVLLLIELRAGNEACRGRFPKSLSLCFEACKQCSRVQYISKGLLELLSQAAYASFCKRLLSASLGLGGCGSPRNRLSFCTQILADALTVRLPVAAESIGTQDRQYRAFRGLHPIGYIELDNATGYGGRNSGDPVDAIDEGVQSVLTRVFDVRECDQQAAKGREGDASRELCTGKSCAKWLAELRPPRRVNRRRSIELLLAESIVRCRHAGVPG
jgi:hypothetical protein